MKFKFILKVIGVSFLIRLFTTLINYGLPGSDAPFYQASSSLYAFFILFRILTIVFGFLILDKLKQERSSSS